MSLSRPVRFPLLKLPFLCIKCVLHNWDDFVLICFATFSKRARRVVKYSSLSMEEINIIANRNRQISIGDATAYTEIRKTWHFKHGRRAVNGEFVLQRGSKTLRTCRGYHRDRGHYLESYTTGATLDALKLGVDIMINVFGFTDKYVFYLEIPADFYCDPRVFKSRQMYFSLKGSADWVTVEILCQFDVGQLFFSYHRFSEEDIVAYITYWFNSGNRKLEWIQFAFNWPSYGNFNIDHLNPMPFCQTRRNGLSFVNVWQHTDMSSGKDILRKDGLLATFLLKPSSVQFFVWHQRFPDPVQQ
ncbi:unnamed protein product [Caenorhabditis brenneri]